ncbi:phosphonopyruvate decarboxylase [Candidatus Atribacteria bacterium HGW-Atribacteria-1]|nr:MAG: phosphonopyruvate decarboxylase [Candidatus Atribacteria bacterium HGW-Atribacteria-1]
MIKCEDFYNLLIKNEIDFFCGVPDSLLKYPIAYISDHTMENKNIITANEGNAIALVAGYHLATGRIGMVYMQNSGEGNAINPLTSLTDKKVYSIPLLLLIGWRGEPGKKDEPQHIKQGEVTKSLLDILGIPYSIMPESIEETHYIISEAVKYMKKQNSAYAIIVKEEIFEPYILINKSEKSDSISREDALRLVIDQLTSQDIIVSTTGKLSRELFEYREELKQNHNGDFLTVGSMGHCSQIALGIAISKPTRNVYCFDGDGAVIMHMGSLAIIGSQKSENFKHIIFNNGAHDSVGGQVTVGFQIDIPAIAKACGYNSVFEAKTKEEITKKINLLKTIKGPSLLEIKIRKGARQNLGRPTISPKENKKAFMDFIRK